MKKGLENELFDLIDMDDVAQIKKKLERNTLDSLVCSDAVSLWPLRQITKCFC